MTVLATYTKDPDEVLDYTIDYAPLLEDDETITTSTWEITPTGLTEDDTAESDQESTIWVSAGSHGVRYELVNTIVTDQGRTFLRAIAISVRGVETSI